MEKIGAHEGWKDKNMSKFVILHTNLDVKFILSNPCPPTISFFIMEWVEAAFYWNLLT